MMGPMATPSGAASDAVRFVLDRFNAMLDGDGAHLEVLTEEPARLTVRYVPPEDDAECESCVLHPDDLEQLVAEALAGRGSSITEVVIER